MPANIQQILTQHYGLGFSFVVCVFDRKVQAHPIAYVSQRMQGTGHLFIPTRHAHGEADTLLTQQGLPLHVGVNCDRCQTSPIPGTRWKCIQCANYDLCDGCYSTRGNSHFDHLFAHIPLPIKPAPKMRAPRYDGGWTVGAASEAVVNDGDWDHTIFIANAALLAPPSSYTSGVAAKLGNGNRALNMGLALLHPEAGNFDHLTKITIRGDFENRDYCCAEYTK